MQISARSQPALPIRSRSPACVAHTRVRHSDCGGAGKDARQSDPRWVGLVLAQHRGCVGRDARPITTDALGWLTSWLAGHSTLNARERETNSLPLPTLPHLYQPYLTAAARSHTAPYSLFGDEKRLEEGYQQQAYEQLQPAQISQDGK